jgi:peptidoglycan hydrolase CwlO-like protein
MIPSYLSTALLSTDKNNMILKLQIDHMLQQIEKMNNEITKTQQDINKLRVQVAVNESAINRLLTANT